LIKNIKPLHIPSSSSSASAALSGAEPSEDLGDLCSPLPSSCADLPRRLVGLPRRLEPRLLEPQLEPRLEPRLLLLTL